MSAADLGIQTAPFLKGRDVPCQDRVALFDAAGHSTSGGRTCADTVRVAKAICRSCPLVEPCAQWAYDNREFGVWGGTTDWERTAARQKAARERRPPKAVAS